MNSLETFKFWQEVQGRPGAKIKLDFEGMITGWETRMGTLTGSIKRVLPEGVYIKVDSCEDKQFNGKTVLMKYYCITDYTLLKK